MVASETPTSAAIRRNASRPFFCSASMMALSTASTWRARVTAPLRAPPSRSLRNAQRLDHGGSHCVNWVTTSKLFVPSTVRKGHGRGQSPDMAPRLRGRLGVRPRLAGLPPADTSDGRGPLGCQALRDPDRNERENDHEQRDDVDDRLLDRAEEVREDPDRQRLLRARGEDRHDDLVPGKREREQSARKGRPAPLRERDDLRSEEHTSELQSRGLISYA